MHTYDLQVETDTEEGIARLRLRDGDGRHLALHTVRIEDHAKHLWRGLFDTRDHVERWAGSRDRGDRILGAEDLLDEIGLFLGREVLGEEITRTLAEGVERRLIRVFLPEVTREDRLATAFARVPWEIARWEPGTAPLLAGHAVVRTVPGGVEPGAEERVVQPADGEPLRVLLVFAEAPGSRPLAMRREREELLHFFHHEVMSHTATHPERRVEVEVLCHGVSREVLRQALGKRFHVVHWSGHGHHDLLELHGDDGEPDRIRGGELVEMIRQRGGYVPELVFLSACLSGVTLPEPLRRERRERDSALAQDGPESAEDGDSDAADSLAAAAGFTGTAASLLAAGVPQVVAMRYAVGDDYARDLARRFYHDLLALDAPESAEGALNRARCELLEDRLPEHSPVDHATPVVFGGTALRFAPPDGRSDDLDRRRPRPQPLLYGSRELDPRPDFVGRGAPLTRLHLHWLEPGGSARPPAVAIVHGLGGLGKTALAAEAIHLWHRRFKWVFAFQAKPHPLRLEDLLSRLDRRLRTESTTYGAALRERPAAALHRPPEEGFTGSERHAALRHALLDALRAEPILLVLDNFETNLESVGDAGADRCADPEWDALLAFLADRLPETGSRLLITSRRRPAVLANHPRALQVALDPLPESEAWLYLRGHRHLRALVFSDDPDDQRLAGRVLEVSRGHPLILDRLAAFAADPAALRETLDELAAMGGLSDLPEVFARRLGDDEREAELRYLEDVAQTSIDLLLERLAPEARRLAWVISLAFEPVWESLLQGVWSGRSREDEAKAQLRALLERLDELPPELRQQVAAMPEEMRRAVLEEPPVSPEAPPIEPLLDDLVTAGLVQATDDDPPHLQVHELVRERLAAWMDAHPEERAGRTAADVHTAYGEHYAAAHRSLRRQPTPEAQSAAAEVGRRALTYFVHARALDRLSSFAGRLVTGTHHPSFLAPIIATLETVANEAPPGKMRWSLRTYLADALSNAGLTDRALPLYTQAAEEAEAAGHLADLGVVLQNHGSALRDAGRLDEAKSAFLRSAEVKRKRGAPRALVLGSELEAMRIDLMADRAEASLPEIESRLAEVREWWQRTRRGEEVAEAPDEEYLGRALISGLDIARMANCQLERWRAVLDHVDEIEAIETALGRSEHQRALTRFNRHGPLMELGRLDEAEETLEGCLEVYRRVGDTVREARALSGLASVMSARNAPSRAADLQRRALAVRNALPHPEDRGSSHNNLANFLVLTGDHEEAVEHRAAALVYFAISSQGHLPTCVGALTRHLRQARTAGHELSLPRLPDLVTQPEFDALRRFLAEQGIDAEEMQEQLDPLLAQVVEAAPEGGEEG